MSLPQIIHDRVRTLPVALQQEVLEFVELLRLRSSADRPAEAGGLSGALQQAEPLPAPRPELWKEFPRE